MLDVRTLLKDAINGSSNNFVIMSHYRSFDWGGGMSLLKMYACVLFSFSVGVAAPGRWSSICGEGRIKKTQSAPCSLDSLELEGLKAEPEKAAILLPSVLDQFCCKKISFHGLSCAVDQIVKNSDSTNFDKDIFVVIKQLILVLGGCYHLPEIDKGLQNLGHEIPLESLCAIINLCLSKASTACLCCEGDGGGFLPDIAFETGCDWVARRWYYTLAYKLKVLAPETNDKVYGREMDLLRQAAQRLRMRGWSTQI